MIILAFVVILLLTFGLMAFATRPSPNQAAMERRISDIRSSRAELGTTGEDSGQLLKAERESQFGRLEDLLQKHQIAQILQTRITQADSKTTVARLLFN